MSTDFHRPSDELEHCTLVQIEQLPALRVRNAHADALIALQGAQLLEYTPRGQRPVIWLSESARFQRGVAVRGGIPVCWPWFGALERNPGPVRERFRDAAPAHGLVRTRDWTLIGIAETAAHTEITLSYPGTGLPDHWRAELSLTITVGAQLQLRLRTRNTGAAPLHFSQALHSYFAVGAIDAVEVLGLDQAPYFDTLEQWREYRQEGALRIEGEVDRVYLDTAQAIDLHDKAWNRRLRIRSNARGAVVWNPGIGKARRLSQFQPDAWQRMLCIESANVMRDSVSLEPGAGRCLELHIDSRAD